MDKNARIAGELYRYSEMSLYILQQVLRRVRNQRLRAQLQVEFREYALLNMQIKDFMLRRGYPDSSMRALAKLRLFLLYELELTRRHTTGHIAALLIQENLAGVISAIRLTRAFGEAEQQVAALAARLRRMEEYNIERLKAFL